MSRKRFWVVAVERKTSKVWVNYISGRRIFMDIYKNVVRVQFIDCNSTKKREFKTKNDALIAIYDYMSKYTWK